MPGCDPAAPAPAAPPAPDAAAVAAAATANLDFFFAGTAAAVPAAADADCPGNGAGEGEDDDDDDAPGVYASWDPALRKLMANRLFPLFMVLLAAGVGCCCYFSPFTSSCWCDEEREVFWVLSF